MSTSLPSYEEAAALVAAQARKLVRPLPRIERVELGRSNGRVLGKPLVADQDQPPFPRSTRDGFACRAAEASAHLSLAVAGTTRAGEAPAAELPHGCAWEIMTGAPVPPGADAVMMLEHVKAERDHVQLAANRSVDAGENIVAQGAQARKGEVLLQAGTPISAAQVALAASCGKAMIEVYRRPRVAILTTGDEIVSVKSVPGPGQIRNSNGPMLASMVANAGGEAWVLPTALDIPEVLDGALAQAAEADLLLITGGVSAGKFDLVEPALARAGAHFHFTGVRMQPGKPLVFGEMGGKKDAVRALPFFGLPGNPVSTAVTFLLFAVPVLTALAGVQEAGPRFALARLDPEVRSQAKPGLTRFLPAKCTFGAMGQLPEVSLVPSQGSGDMGAMALCNCFLVVPEEPHSPEPDGIVRILLF